MRKNFVASAITIVIAAGAIAIYSSNRAKDHASIAALFPMGEDFDFIPPVSGSYKLHTLKPVPDGSVLTADGSKHELSDVLAGKVSLVSFVYLMCGDVNGCPLATSTLFDIYDTNMLAPVLHDHVQLLTISFDPDRDTVEAIKSFSYPILQDTDANQKVVWRVLITENQAALQPILDGFGQVVDRSNDEDRLNHLLRMFLVDRKGIFTVWV